MHTFRIEALSQLPGVADDPTEDTEVEHRCSIDYTMRGSRDAKKNNVYRALRLWTDTP